MTVPGRGHSHALRPWVWVGVFLVAWAVTLGWVQLISPAPHHVGSDFRIFWTSGRNLRTGSDPYVPVVGPLGFVYPPFALLPFAALSFIPLRVAYLLWLGLGAGCLTAIVALGTRRGLAPGLAPFVLLVMLLDGYTERTDWFGQLGLLLVCLVVVDLVGMGNRRGAGVLTGIAAGLKLVPAIMLVCFLARRQWRAAATMVLSFLATMAVGLVATPHWTRRYWSDLVVHHQLGTGVPTQYGTSSNQSLGNAVMMLSGSVTHGHLLIGRCVALAVGGVAVLAGARAAMLGRVWLATGVLGIGSCLMTATAWDHHYLWFLLLLMAAACGELRRMWVSGLVLVVWTVWSCTWGWLHLMHVPLATISGSQLARAVATPVLAALFCLGCWVELHGVSRGRRRSGEPTSPPG